MALVLALLLGAFREVLCFWWTNTAVERGRPWSAFLATVLVDGSYLLGLFEVLERGRLLCLAYLLGAGLVAAALQRLRASRAPDVGRLGSTARRARRSCSRRSRCMHPPAHPTAR
jgi:hypothetical protein